MKIAVIHDAPIPSPSARQILIALVKRGVEASYLRISKITGVIEDSGYILNYGRKRLSIEGALVRSIGMISSIETLMKRIDILREIELSGRPVINSPDSILKARDKFTAMQILKLRGLRVPPTVVTEDLYLIPEIIKEWGSAVIKPLVGSMGYGAILVKDPDVGFMIGKAWLTHGQPILIQKYMRRGQRDIRIIVSGGRVLGGIYREAVEGVWKTNVAQGARVRKAEISHELEEVAIKSTEVLGLKYSGVDIGETDDGYVIYEVNAMPNWQGFMEATGINPAESIAELIIRELKS